jgi:hypothetical protein
MKSATKFSLDWDKEIDNEDENEDCFEIWNITINQLYIN